MGSKGHIPPHMRRPVPGPGMFRPEPFVPVVRPPFGALPFDVMVPPESVEQKLALQHMEMQTLDLENHRLAATHSALRHELATTQHELQRIEAHLSAVKLEHEQQMRATLDKLSKMEADLKASGSVKIDLQTAHAEAESLAIARHELLSKVHQLTQELQKSHGDAQQIPSLLSELDALRQEYQHYRATYDYERKLRIDHYESLQVMEKNYVSMLGEVEKLHKELSNANNSDKAGGQYGSIGGYKQNDTSVQHPLGQTYEDGYRVSQENALAGGAAQFGGAPARSGPAPRPVYDVVKSTSYEAPRGVGFDASAAPHYDVSRAPSYEPPRGLNYDSKRVPGYEAHSTGAGPAAAGNPSPHMMAQVHNPYGSTEVLSAYGGQHFRNPYGPSAGSALQTGGHDIASRGVGAPQGHR
ncbi:hypothetical protein HPP92_005171 [Vanilla planifolia]|uniref:Protein FLX-like 2 n=1 Tax=Vanilla planifolia TaxID=51239 RepID=A0A835RJS1_VANPL|nr:hypothetical protein HPP92_005171 [Vanilla planifolia]